MAVVRDIHRLLPCAYCNSKASIEKLTGKKRIVCTNEFCQKARGFVGTAWFDDIEDAIRAWNTRKGKVIEIAKESDD